MRLLDAHCGHGDFLPALHQIMGINASYYGFTLAHHEVEYNNQASIVYQSYSRQSAKPPGTIEWE